MKELHGRGSARTPAAPGRCLDFLADIEGYPRWYPDVVRAVEVLDRDGDGRAERVLATLHAAVGPIQRDLRLELTVARGEGSVRLTRVQNELSDPERFQVLWRVAADGDGSRIDLDLEANLDVPRLVPLGGVGDSLASGFAEAAARGLQPAA